MIEKIKIDYDSPCRLRQEYGEKINEIIDTIYDMQLAISNLDPDSEWYDGNHIADTSKKVDSYAEQRKWIGCVCRFWYDNPDNTTLDYLGKIQTGENGIEYYGKETYDWFPHCEPILPTDNAIYKGGDNE